VGLSDNFGFDSSISVATSNPLMFANLFGVLLNIKKSEVQNLHYSFVIILSLFPYVYHIFTYISWLYFILKSQVSTLLGFSVSPSHAIYCTGPINIIWSRRRPS
jgi:hypothetical protein